MGMIVDVKGQRVKLIDVNELAVFHNKTTKVSTWFLDTFFPNRRVFEGTEIPLGELDTSTPIAPLVAPSVQGRVLMDQAKYSVTHVQPAYLKPSAYITPKNVTDLAILTNMRQAGFIGQGNDMSLTEKLRMAQVGIFARNRDSITNFNILMAIEVALKGKVVLKSPDFPEVTVDYGRHAEMAFTPTIKWDETDATPVTDFRAMNARLIEHGGTDGSVVLTTSKVFGAFAKSDEYKEEFIKPQGANAVNPLMVGSLGGGIQEAKYRGELDGVQWWTLDATYRDENGAIKRYIGEKAFYLISDLDGFLCNCEIQHLDAMNTLVDVYDYIVPNADPSGIKLISESSPLAVPSNVNGAVGGEAFLTA